MRLHKYTAILMMTLVICFALAAPAMAQQIKGGHDETSEVNNPRWATGALTPGVAPALTGIHLLVSEFCVTPTPHEFIEIYNPTSETVDLSKYYLTDAWYEAVPPTSGYYQLPAGTLNITTNTDFCARFPAGATIPAGGVIVVACYGAGVDSSFGVGTVDYEVTPSSVTIPDMVSVGQSPLNPIQCGATGLSNSAELVMLFYWDGASDNVCDVDYVTWGSAGATTRVDKTGFATDGPDPDAIATMYNNDTADALQSPAPAPTVIGQSSARTMLPEGVEAANGNGCVSGGPTPVNNSSWGQIKTLYR